MREFFEQVARGGEGAFSYLALSGALIVPDICGAMESEDGCATPSRYIAWFDERVAPLYEDPRDGTPMLSGEDCYMLRCSFLHQGTTQHEHGSYSRILFVEPNPRAVLHMNIVNDALNIAIREFCHEMAAAALAWLKGVENTEVFKRNYGRFLQRYPEAPEPYKLGLPVIT
jgi:hypothetical protein